MVHPSSASNVTSRSAAGQTATPKQSVISKSSGLANGEFTLRPSLNLMRTDFSSTDLAMTVSFTYYY